MVKGDPAADESFSKVQNFARMEFQLGGDVFGPGKAATVKLKELEETPLTSEEDRKADLEEIELESIFLVQENSIGTPTFIGDLVNDTDDLIIIEGDRGEIGFIAQEVIFNAMVKAIDELANAAFELALNDFNWKVVLVIQGGSFDEQIGDGLGGNAIGIEAIGQNTA